MWECKPGPTPMDANSRLSKKNSPQVADPALHRLHRRITGRLSYLLNMTRPDLAFANSQLSKFVQYRGVVHLQAAEWVLQYVRVTYDQGLTYFGAETRNKGAIIRPFTYLLYSCSGIGTGSSPLVTTRCYSYCRTGVHLLSYSRRRTAALVVIW